MSKKKILVLGKNGMLGSTLFRLFSDDKRFDTFGTVRSLREVNGKRVIHAEATKINSIEKAVKTVRPDLVVNCIGIINKRMASGNLEEALEINGKFPNKLALICGSQKTRLIHFSTDCVFSGNKGHYTETDEPDADDWYGQTKLSGEVRGSKVLTIRTSLIGPEMNSRFGLLEWFLSQKDEVGGYTKAIFSGFPTVEVARIIADYIIPKTDLEGLYHVSADPISKYDLLQLIAKRYKKEIKIKPVDMPRVDRSLDSTKFCQLTGYRPPSWTNLVNSMYIDHMKIK